MSILVINNSILSNLSFDTKTQFPQSKIRTRRFSTRYDELYREIRQSYNSPIKNSKCQLSPQREQFKTFRKVIETKRKENTINKALHKTKMLFLTGNTLEGKERKENYNTIERKSYTTEKNYKLKKNYRDLWNLIKRRDRINLSSMIFRNKMKKCAQLQENENKKLYSNNIFVEKLKREFPEYVNMNTNGNSFISNYDQKFGNFSKLKSRIAKI